MFIDVFVSKIKLFSEAGNWHISERFTSVDVRTPVTDRSLMSSVRSKDECKVSISVGLVTLMFSLVTE